MCDCVNCQTDMSDGGMNTGSPAPPCFHQGLFLDLIIMEFSVTSLAETTVRRICFQMSPMDYSRKQGDCLY